MLRALREARGVTLDGWGARLGVSRTMVQRWERGERAPPRLPVAPRSNGPRRSRAALGDAAFTEAWAAGQALSLEEAIADALADAPPAPAQRQAT